MNNKEKLYLAKQAGAAEGFWAGDVGTGAEKGVGALSGATAGLGATPKPVMDARALRGSNNRLAQYKKIMSGTATGARGVKKLEGLNKNLDRKVPDYMRTEHTGLPKRIL